MIRSTAVLVAPALVLWFDQPVWALEQAVAVFDFELIDMGLQGATYGPGRREDQEHLAWTGEEVRKRLTQAGRFNRLLGPRGVR